MSDEIKHECAVALLRLLDGDGEPSRGGPLAGASDPGGTILSLLLEKQHNRGQDGAGAAILSLSPEPGRPAWWIRRSASATALADLLGAIGRRPAAPGESLFLGHLRYATYGRGDESFCHPFVHAEPRLDRTLFLAGNFNLTNTRELFEAFRKAGNHPASSADGYLLCELLALGLAKPGACASARAAGLASAVCRGFAAPEDPEEKSLRSLRSLREETTTRDARRETSPALRSLREKTTTRDARRETSPALRSLREKTTTRDARRETSPALRSLREKEPPILRALRVVLPKLDGAFTLCGMTGDGWAFAVRDAHGIRPGWYWAPPPQISAPYACLGSAGLRPRLSPQDTAAQDSSLPDETNSSHPARIFSDGAPASPRAVAVASERPAIQAALDCPTDAVRELPPGVALLVSPSGEVRFERVIEPAEPRPCVFERIYFSRANDADIHSERKALGAALAAPLLRAVGNDLENTFFSYIPNSAQVAFHGLLAALWTEGLAEGRPVRFGQVAVKDAKFRTFIADAAARREIGKHVYDVTYGLVRPGVDTLVVLDDSIVRGTTMRDAILPMLDRLGPKRIVIASSAPPIRYPDCYGIDMSTLGELVAFRALVNLLGDEAEAALHAAMEEMSHAESESHAESAENAEFLPHAGDAENAETSSFAAKRHPSFAPHAHPSFVAERHSSFAPQAHPSFVNPLAALYARFTDAEHAAEIARLLTPPRMHAEVSVVYQTVAALRAVVASPKSQVAGLSCAAGEGDLGPATCDPRGGIAAAGDWYFTGDYPTPGGYRVLRRSLENHLARREGRSY